VCVCVFAGVCTQIGRVAYFVRTIPGFVKRLLFVLEAVAGIVQKESANYVPTEVVTSITDRKPGRTALKAVLSFASKYGSDVSPRNAAC
jgi:hypothetical protein